MTVGAFLTEQWLPSIKATIRLTTLAMYEQNLRAHVVPALGAVQLRTLTAPPLNAFYGELLSKGRKDGKGDFRPGPCASSMCCATERCGMPSAGD